MLNLSSRNYFTYFAYFSILKCTFHLMVYFYYLLKGHLYYVASSYGQRAVMCKKNNRFYSGERRL